MPFTERFFNGNNYLELNASGLRVWRGDELRPVDLTGCNRIIIYHGVLRGDWRPRDYIEFQFDKQNRTYCLDKEHFWTDNKDLIIGLPPAGQYNCVIWINRHTLKYPIRTPRN